MWIMKKLGEGIHATEDRFYTVFYSTVAILLCAFALVACSSDLHGVKVEVVRKLPDIIPPSVVIQQPLPAAGGS
jgi:hypothetical protein